MSKPITKKKHESGNDHPSTSYFRVPRVLCVYIYISIYLVDGFKHVFLVLHIWEIIVPTD